MADNLKQLIGRVNEVFDNTKGPNWVKVLDHNDIEQQIIKKTGKNTGFPFLASANGIDGTVPIGTISWNGNLMNNTDLFTFTLSEKTLDFNKIEEYLKLLAIGSLIHFKDFVGRSVILKYHSYVKTTDSGGNNILNVSVNGVVDNINYAYQSNEYETCIIEFFNNGNSGVLESTIGTLEVDRVVKKVSIERNYIFEGDSRMATGTYNETAISEFLADASNFKNTGNISNFAVGGSSIAGMQSRYTSNVYPLRPNGTTVKEAYLFVLIGINDLTVASPDAIAIYNSLSSYATTAKNDGFKVVVFTTFYRQDFTILQEKARIDFNEYIKSNSNLFFAIIDTESLFPPSKNDLFYYDVVHLRSSGNRLIADFVNKIFNSSFNAGNSYDRSFLQDTFTPRSGTININSGNTFPLKVTSTESEAYIHLRNSTSSNIYGGLIRSFGDNIGFYHGNGVVPSLVLNSDGSSQFGGSITAGNINVGNALYFGGGNNYLTFGGGRLLSNVGVEVTNYKLSSLNTAPASATATGTTGEIRVTATHIYVCTATNTWVRSALTTW